MDNNMYKSIGTEGFNQAPPLSGNSSLPQPYDTNKNYSVSSEQPFPIIPILKSNNSYMSNSSGYHVQQMMPPVQNNNAIVANNFSNQLDQLNLMPENSLTNEGHMRFISNQLPSFSNDAYFGSINFDSSASGSNGANNASGSDISNMSTNFDDDTFYKFFDSYEPNNSSSIISTFQVEEQQPNVNAHVSRAPLPPHSPIPNLRFNASASEGILSTVGPSSQLRRSHSMDSINSFNVPMTETMHASAPSSSSSFNPTNRPFFECRMKHYSNDDIAAIFQVDPRRAKRILANRRAVARITNRNERHKAELENQLCLLQSKVPALCAQFAMMKSHLESLTIENRQLQLQMEAAKQKNHLQEELTERLNVEIAHLKLLQASLAQNFETSF